MKPIYHHYETWEDFKHGMYEEQKKGRKARVQQAMAILSDTDLLYKCMKRVTEEWTNATEQNLSNDMYGHRAFLGQTACSIYAGIHEDETREAWGLLTEDQRYKANKVADKVFDEWQTAFIEKKEGYYQQSLFD